MPDTCKYALCYDILSDEEIVYTEGDEIPFHSSCLDEYNTAEYERICIEYGYHRSAVA